MSAASDVLLVTQNGVVHREDCSTIRPDTMVMAWYDDPLPSDRPCAKCAPHQEFYAFLGHDA